MAEKELNEYLRKGENVRWSGRTAPFPLLGDRSREQIVLKWAVTAALTCGFLWLYCGRDQAVNGKFVALVVLVAGLVIASPWMEQRSIMGQQYFITDQRAILMSRDKTFYSMELNGIDELRRVSLHGEADTLVMGGIIMEDIRKQLRWRACHPKTDMQGQKKQDEALGMVFYGIRDADLAESLLHGGQVRGKTA